VFCYLIIIVSEKPLIRAKNLTDTIQELQTSYNTFKNMNGQQLHDVWNQLFFDCEYQLDGKVRKKEFDCVGAETTFWNALGANVEYENTEMKEQRLQRVSKSHASIKTVEIGDIIVFKRAEKYGHIAVIEYMDKQKNRLRYMDMNIIDNGPGYHVIAFNDPRIQAVYPMSFDYFCGNILNKYDRKQ